MRALTEYFPSARRPAEYMENARRHAGGHFFAFLSIEEYFRDVGLAVTLADGDADGCVGP